jgi:hypothetical protein
VPNVQRKTPDDGQRNHPKHVDFLDKNKFGKISASIGFIKKKLSRDYIHHWHESTDSRENTKTFYFYSFSLAILLMGEARELSATLKQEIIL